ncbi:Gamma-glutamylcyclotransferase [Rhynchospora pubera]|uniref:glutathione-specific gamma-glutamylcyclotransferase n=1 Tax=Rhynchospora pubera TaxID=906938 RepID=A0AAV8HRI8_9POAL|nr:Gamma-glutamylcyclotransferase [Rhynchospora pubera]
MLGCMIWSRFGRHRISVRLSRPSCKPAKAKALRLAEWQTDTLSPGLPSPFRLETMATATWIFGYGSLIWRPGFAYEDKLVGFIKHYRRVFYQGSTDHRGTPSFPGRTVTLNSSPDDLCWGVAYKLKEDDKQTVLQDLEFREKQYDMKLYLDFYTDLSASTPAVTDVMVYYASPNKELNPNYLGPAPLEDIARQIIQAEGPSGPNRDYLFLLEEALLKFGCEDPHVRDLANAVRRLL